MAKFKSTSGDKNRSMIVPANFRKILENIKLNYGCDMKTTMEVIAERILDLDVDWSEEGKKCKVVSEDTRARMSKSREKVSALRQQVIELHEQDYSVDEIHEETGAKITTIESWTGIAQERIVEYVATRNTIPTVTQLIEKCNVTKATAKGAIAVMSGDKPTRFYQTPAAKKAFAKFK